MKRHLLGLIVTAVAVASFTRPDATKARSSGLSSYVGSSLCAKPDTIVLSCPLQGSRKIVSICAGGSSEPYSFYYTYGRLRSPELTFPAPGRLNTPAINHTTLSSANTQTFSFSNAGIRYIVYRMETAATPQVGIIVQDIAHNTVLTRDLCAPDRITATQDPKLRQAITSLPQDAELQSGGLPPDQK